MPRSVVGPANADRELHGLAAERFRDYYHALFREARL